MASVILQPSGNYSNQCVEVGGTAWMSMAGLNAWPAYIYTLYSSYNVFTVDTNSIPVGSTIESVKVTGLLNYTGFSDIARFLIQFNDTQYFSDNITPTSSYVSYNFTWTVNPYTSNAFTKEEIDSLLIGVDLRGYAPNGGVCAILNTTITYTEPVSTFVPKIIFM